MSSSTQSAFAAFGCLCAVILVVALVVFLDGGKAVRKAAEEKAFELAVQHVKQKVLGLDD